MLAKWQLVQRYGKQGHWLPPLVRLLDYNKSWHDRNNHISHLPRVIGAIHSSALWNGFELGTANRSGQQSGNLLNEEYRFFSGHPYNLSNFSACRCCLKSCFGSLQRDEHKTIGCTKALVAAQKLVQAYKVCMVCDKRTDKRNWGWPICDEECVIGWKYYAVQPLALRVAIERTDYAKLLS